MGSKRANLEPRGRKERGRDNPDKTFKCSSLEVRPTGSEPPLSCYLMPLCINFLVYKEGIMKAFPL